MTRKRAGVVRREPDVPEGTQPHCSMWLIWYVNFIILFQSSSQILTPVRSFNYFKPESSAVPATEIGDTGETEDVAEAVKPRTLTAWLEPTGVPDGEDAEICSNSTKRR